VVGQTGEGPMSGENSAKKKLNMDLAAKAEAHYW